MSNNKFDSRQSKLAASTSMIGSAANDTLDTIFPKINDELAKLFEDRNLLLVGGGDVAVNGAATSVTFSAALALHLNSKVAGGAPTVIDLTATTRAFSADGRMLYAVIDRSLGTATVTADSATLPAVTSANQEVVLIAKRVGTDIIFRDGTKIPASRTVKLGSNDIFGSMGATDNKLVRTDGTDGKTVQGTGITVDDSNNLSTPGTVYSGASTIHASAAMQFDSTLKGALVPRMTTTEQNAIAAPATGLLIFNTTTNAFHYYNGSSWQAVGVTALNGLYGAVTLAAGANVSITPSGNTLTIASTGGSSRAKIVTSPSFNSTELTICTITTTANDIVMITGSGLNYTTYFPARGVADDVNGLAKITTSAAASMEIRRNGALLSGTAQVNTTGAAGTYIGALFTPVIDQPGAGTWTYTIWNSASNITGFSGRFIVTATPSGL